MNKPLIFQELNKRWKNQGYNDSSIYANQSMLYTTLTNWIIKTVWSSQ